MHQQLALWVVVTWETHNARGPPLMDLGYFKLHTSNQTCHIIPAQISTKASSSHSGMSRVLSGQRPNWIVQ